MSRLGLSPKLSDITHSRNASARSLNLEAADLYDPMWKNSQGEVVPRRNGRQVSQSELTINLTGIPSPADGDEALETVKGPAKPYQKSRGCSFSSIFVFCGCLGIMAVILVVLSPTPVTEATSRYHQWMGTRMTLEATDTNITGTPGSSDEAVGTATTTISTPSLSSDHDPLTTTDITILRQHYTVLQKSLSQHVEALQRAQQATATCETSLATLKKQSLSRNRTLRARPNYTRKGPSQVSVTNTGTGTTPHTQAIVAALTVAAESTSDIDLPSHDREWLYCPTKSARHRQVLQFCPEKPNSEQHYQLGFFDNWNSKGQLVPMFKRPVTPNCVQPPPPGYRWPGRVSVLPAPLGTNGTYWPNLRVNELSELKVFNPSAYKNLYHFDAPRYDIEFRENIAFGEKYIPLATKIRLAFDVGSGGGSFGLWLKWKYDIQTLSTAFPDWPYCEYITERGNLCMYLDAMYAFPFAKFTFDLVHVSWVYHSSDLPELEAAFRELYRITRPGGYLWMSDGWSQAQVTLMEQLIDILGLVVLYDRRKAHNRETYFGKNPYEVQWWTILLKPISARLDPACANGATPPSNTNTPIIATTTTTTPTTAAPTTPTLTIPFSVGGASTTTTSTSASLDPSAPTEKPLPPGAS